MSPALVLAGIGALVVVCLVVAVGLAAALGGPALFGALGAPEIVPGAAATTPAVATDVVAAATPTEALIALVTDTPSPLPSPTPEPTPEPTPVPTEIAVPVGMVLVPGGTFTMGGGDQRDSQPAHDVTLSPFFMDQHEVTNARYVACVDDGACTPPLRRGSETRGAYFSEPAFAEYPVINVTWDQAQAFCRWEGKRLPTEAQWEYAAMGEDGRRYPWGNNFDANLVPVRANDTVQTGSFPENVSPFGLFDMAGNVVEWVADWYAEDYYSTSPGTDPTGPETGTRKVMRGGSWGNPDAAIYATTRRFSRPPNGADVDIGFRCAMPAP
jgi:eukaryotic-like serine/threonine-protein kinase